MGQLPPPPNPLGSDCYPPLPMDQLAPLPPYPSSVWILTFEKLRKSVNNVTYKLIKKLLSFTNNTENLKKKMHEI